MLAPPSSCAQAAVEENIINRGLGGGPSTQNDLIIRSTPTYGSDDPLGSGSEPDRPGLYLDYDSDKPNYTRDTWPQIFGYGYRLASKFRPTALVVSKANRIHCPNLVRVIGLVSDMADSWLRVHNSKYLHMM